MFAPNIQNVAVTTDATPEAQRQRLLAAALARKKMAEADTTTGRGRQQQPAFAPRNGGQMAAGLGMVAMGELLNKIATDRETEKAKESAMAQADAMVTAVQSLGGPWSKINLPALKGAFLTNPELASQVVKMGMENMLKPPEERFEMTTLPDGRQAQRSTKTGKIEPLSEGKLLTPEQFAQQEALKKAGAANNTTKVEGTIPPGYRMERDQQGNAVQLVPIPGGPVAQEQAEKAKKQDLERRQKQQSGANVFHALNDIERLMNTATLPTTGAMGSIASRMAGTNASDIAKTLSTIRSNTAFETLREMRAASPTGAALGAVSDSELKLLQDNVAALEQSQSEEQFRKNLARVRNQFEVTIHGRPLSPEERVKMYEMTDPGAQVGRQPPPPANLQPAAPPAPAPVQGPPMPQEAPMQPPMPQAAPAPQGLPPLDLIEQEILRRQQQQMQQMQQQPSMPMVP